MKIYGVFVLFLSAAVLPAAPVFPPTPACLFNGTGSLTLSGEWQKHPVFKNYSPSVDFKFKGIRTSGGETRIRYTEDFGETACETYDDTEKGEYWYRGTDNIFKSSYKDHAFQGGLNPFEYSIILQKRLNSRTIDSAIQNTNNEMVFRIHDVKRDGGQIIEDFYLKIKENQITSFRQFTSYNFPQQNINLAFDTHKITWSDEVIALDVPKFQISEFYYGLQGITEPVITIKITLNIDDLRPIPKTLNIEKYQEELVSGLFKSQQAIPPRRMPESAITQEAKKKPYIIFLFVGFSLLGIVLYSFVKRSKTS